jgi:hypothetical protein
MAEQPSLLKNIVVKGAIGAVVGATLYVAASMLSFPEIFCRMFVLYAMLGTTVFILLDAPSLNRIGGLKAFLALVAFYLVLSGVYIGGASFLPQYDPEDEKGKIEKILKPRRAATEQGKTEELLARTKALAEKADSLLARIHELGGDQQPSSAAGASDKPSAPALASGDIVALGKEQWNLQECYNCHKLFGEGGKKRGPELDNIGNLLKPDEMKQKIVDPQTFMAEGFEKEYEKKKMPAKYRELMTDPEIDALVAFLSTLKNASVNTPKPIKKK